MRLEHRFWPGVMIIAVFSVIILTLWQDIPASNLVEGEPTQTSTSQVEALSEELAQLGK